MRKLLITRITLGIFDGTRVTTVQVNIASIEGEQTLTVDSSGRTRPKRLQLTGLRGKNEQTSKAESELPEALTGAQGWTNKALTQGQA